MHHFLKKSLLVLIIALLPAACGPFVTAPATELVVVSEPTQQVPTLALPADMPSESFDQYIGMQYPPFPAGLTQEFSMLIQDSDRYGLFLVTDGENKMLWMSKVTGYDSNSNPNWKVMDVLDFSDVEAGLTLIPDGCLLNGVPDSEILVATKNGVGVWAWRANKTLNFFETIHTIGIECHSDKGWNFE